MLLKYPRPYTNKVVVGLSFNMLDFPSFELKIFWLCKASLTIGVAFSYNTANYYKMIVMIFYVLL